MPGYTRSDLQLLPSSKSKHTIWEVYHKAAEADGTIHPVAYTTFCYLWRKLVPSILVMKPRSDLCWQCQQNSAAIVRTANSLDAVKSQAIMEALEHLRIVKTESAHYKSTCEDCKKKILAYFTTGDIFTPPPPYACIPCNSNNIKVHYSFDYAQQVHYPSDPQQPGPIYFLTPRKCTIFGVTCEAIPRHINFLTDEAADCGKGANAVISRLHFFFANHGLGERQAFLHADNCTGQNKNNCMMHYLVWRVLTHRHSDITIFFLPVGHTKFAPDWCFGLFKRQYRWTKVGSLHDISEVTDCSANCNFPQLVAEQDGSIIVPTYDWTNFFISKMKKISGIKRYHHFRVTSSHPGSVFLRRRSDTPEVEIDLLRDPWSPEEDELPTVIYPSGFSAARQWYLYEQIRPFCPDEDKDAVCPLPQCPKPGASRESTPVPDESTPVSVESDQAPRAKRKRVCGLCKEAGHDKRTCPQK